MCTRDIEYIVLDTLYISLVLCSRFARFLARCVASNNNFDKSLTCGLPIELTLCCFPITSNEGYVYTYLSVSMCALIYTNPSEFSIHAFYIYINMLEFSVYIHTHTHHVHVTTFTCYTH